MAKLTALLLVMGFLCISAINGNKIKLTEVNALTLHKGQYTTARRLSPVQQLQCKGSACTFAPDTVQCINKGTDGNSVQWACDAEIPTSLHLKLHYISCEGYESSTDPFVLVGSCSLTYNLEGEIPITTQQTTYNDNGDLTGFGIIIIIAIILCGCSRRQRGVYYNGTSDFVHGAVIGGAAATALHGGRRGWFAPRRRPTRSWGGGRATSRRTARGFCGTRNR